MLLFNHIFELVMGLKFLGVCLHPGVVLSINLCYVRIHPVKKTVVGGVHRCQLLGVIVLIRHLLSTLGSLSSFSNGSLGRSFAMSFTMSLEVGFSVSMSLCLGMVMGLLMSSGVSLGLRKGLH